MCAVLFISRADILQHVTVGYQHLGGLDRERFGVHFWIVDRQLQIHMAEITPMEAFPNPQILALRVLVQTRIRTECRLGVAAVSIGKTQAASAAFHSSERVAIRIPSLPVLNWRFLIFSANSIPLMVIAALSNRLNPSIGRIRCFTRR